MRVLVVTQYFWPEHFRITDLARGLIERGHEVTVLTGCPNYPGGRIFKGYGFFNRREIHNGIRIVRVPLLPRGSNSPLRLALNYLSFAFSASVLGPLLCKGCFDVIFVCQLSPVTVAFPGILLSKIKRAPLLMWVLDLWPDSLSAAGGIRSPQVLGMIDRMVRFIYRHCDRLLLASEGFTSSVCARNVEPCRLRHFPNWVEPLGEVPQNDPPVLPEGFRIVFGGNVGASQDFETILRVAEQLKYIQDIQWIIVGDGRRLAWLRAQILQRRLEGCFHLMGHFPPEYMPSIFAMADVLLVTLRPEPAFAQTIPGKIQSYMACGKPILAALDGEGGRLIHEAKCGLAVPAGDAQSLSAATKAMYEMTRDELAAMGRSGKIYCDVHFCRKFLLHHLETWMQELTHRTPVPVTSSNTNRP